MPNDAQETEHRAAMLALIAQADNPFDRRLFAPGHLTASAFVVSRDTGMALSIFHRKLNRWRSWAGM